MLQHVSLELTNRCGKGCAFCYNASSPLGASAWDLEDLTALVVDLAAHGVEAVSFGGGEPLESSLLLPLLERTRGLLARSVTTNGLLLTEHLAALERVRPERVHVSLHHPSEFAHVLDSVRLLEARGIEAGVNLLVRPGDAAALREPIDRLHAAGLGDDRLVLLPLRGSGSPHPDELGQASGGRRFLSTTCLTGCARSPRFCSVRWDRTVAWCSYTPARAALRAPTHAALLEALDKAGHAPCTASVPLGRVRPVRTAQIPAAHSMDSDWFAVDEDGHVAEFESGEAGAVPRAFLDGVGVQYSASQLYQLIAEDPASEVPLLLDGFAHDPDGKVWKLPWPGDAGPETLSDLHDVSEWETLLLWLPDREALTEVPGLVPLRTTSHFFAVVPGARVEVARAMLARKRVLRVYRDFEYRAEQLGFFRYSHLDRFENWTSGSYGREVAPQRPLHVGTLRGEAAAVLSHVRFEGLCFAREAQVQPAERHECASHQHNFYPAYQDEPLPLRPDPPGRLPVGRPDVHLYVAAACEALDPAGRPAGPFHARGPKPKLEKVERVLLARWIVAALEPSLPQGERALVQQVCADADAFLASPTLHEGRTHEPLEGLVLEPGAPTHVVRLLGSARGFPTDSAHLAAARRLAQAVVHAHAGDEGRLGRSVLELAREVVVLFEVGMEGARLPSGAEFVRALDDQMLRLELARECEARAQVRPGALDVVVWRGAQPGAQTPEVWVAQLAGSAWGLLVQLGGAWRWVEASRDDVLATVPERWFAEATRAVVGPK